MGEELVSDIGTDHRKVLMQASQRGFWTVLRSFDVSMILYGTTTASISPLVQVEPSDERRTW